MLKYSRICWNRHEWAVIGLHKLEYAQIGWIRLEWADWHEYTKNLTFRTFKHDKSLNTFML